MFNIKVSECLEYNQYFFTKRPLADHHLFGNIIPGEGLKQK